MDCCCQEPEMVLFWYLRNSHLEVKKHKVNLKLQSIKKQHLFTFVMKYGGLVLFFSLDNFSFFVCIDVWLSSRLIFVFLHHGPSRLDWYSIFDFFMFKNFCVQVSPQHSLCIRLSPDCQKLLFFFFFPLSLMSARANLKCRPLWSSE